MAPTSSSSSKASPAGKKAAADTQKKGTEKKSSRFNVISVCLVLVGIGAILGVFIFYFLFRGRCASKLAANNQYHNATQSELQTKYTKALADIRQCEEDSKHKGELFEMQGRLKAQADLSDKHQALLERHEKTLDRIQELQKNSEGSQTQIQHLEEEVKTIQSALEDSSRKLQNAQKERDAIQQDLKVQVNHTTATLKERVKENSKLRVDLSNCESNAAALDGQLSELKSLVQQQNLAQTVAK
jgi:predicted RNase H-like nuclease (RuvC/YqgF family)